MKRRAVDDEMPNTVAARALGRPSQTSEGASPRACCENMAPRDSSSIRETTPAIRDRRYGTGRADGVGPGSRACDCGEWLSAGSAREIGARRNEAVQALERQFDESGNELPPKPVESKRNEWIVTSPDAPARNPIQLHPQTREADHEPMGAPIPLHIAAEIEKRRTIVEARDRFMRGELNLTGTSKKRCSTPLGNVSRNVPHARSWRIQSKACVRRIKRSYGGSSNARWPTRARITGRSTSQCRK